MRRVGDRAAKRMWQRAGRVVQVDDLAIRALLTRLARPHGSGGDVIERAAILAAGSDFGTIMAWVVAHGGKPETVAVPVPSGGLHGSQMTHSGAEQSSPPLRFVLPRGALTRAPTDVPRP